MEHAFKQWEKSQRVQCKHCGKHYKGGENIKGHINIHHEKICFFNATDAISYRTKILKESVIENFCTEKANN